MTEELREAVAQAHPNIALIKYWGKRDSALNLPAAGSIAVTVGPMSSRTRVRWLSASGEDQILLNGMEGDAATRKNVTRMLDLLRARGGVAWRAEVETWNDFPTAAGLASSASGAAALAFAGNEAGRFRISRQTLSTIARQGSGSACRSLHGGYVEWLKGERPDGEDSHAVALAPAAHWPLTVAIAIIDAGVKSLPSRAAMARTVETSPYFQAWIGRVEQDLGEARRAIATRDLEHLGGLAEGSSLAMFGTMLGAVPPVLYWQAGSVAVMHEVWAWRRQGLPCFFTMDAGPNVKVFCAPEALEAVASRLADLPGVRVVLRGAVGGPASLLSPEDLAPPGTS